MVIWVIKLKEMIRTTAKKKKNILGSNWYLGVGSKGQISLSFFKSVGICDGTPSTARSSYLHTFFLKKSTCNGDIEIIPVSPSIFLSVCSSVTLTLLKPLDEIQPNVSLFHLSVLI